MSLDRMKGAFVALARGAHHNIDYMCMYRAFVLSQTPNHLRVSVKPEDPRLPEMSNIPLRTGIPGVDVVLRLQGAPPIPVLVGWENGKPDRPFAALWPSGIDRNAIERIVIRSLTVELGDEGLDPIRDGVLTGQSIDPFTGLPHWMLANASTTVLAKK